MYPGKGRGITAIKSFKGGLLIWKEPLGLFLADTKDPSPTNWRVTELSDQIGCPSPGAAVLIDNDMIWLDSAGNAQAAQATLNFGSITAVNLSQTAWLRPFIDETFNLGQLSKVQSVFYEAKKQLHFAWAKSGSSVADSRLVLDFMKPGKVRFRFSPRDVNPALWLRLDSNSIASPAIGDNAGTVWLLDKATRSKAGNGYLGQFQTSHYDLQTQDPSIVTRRKIGNFLVLVIDPTTYATLDVDIIWDNQIKDTVRFVVKTGGIPLGQFLLGTDVMGGDNNLITLKKRIRGSGRRFSMRLRNSASGENFSIGRAFLYFTLGDERL